MIATGYHDGNDATALRGDPLFKLALKRLPSDGDLHLLSTISRLENLFDMRTLLRLGPALVDVWCVSFRHVPRRITIDIDDTFDAVHVGQQLRLFNAHYDNHGSQPIVFFDGEDHVSAPNIPPRCHWRCKNCFSPVLYCGRNDIELIFGRQKEFRRSATRNDRLDRHYLVAARTYCQ